MKTQRLFLATCMAAAMVAASIEALVSGGSAAAAARSGGTRVRAPHQNEGSAQYASILLRLLRQQVQYDWGDAPAPYPQFARHSIGGSSPQVAVKAGA